METQLYNAHAFETLFAKLANTVYNKKFEKEQIRTIH